MCQLKFPAKSSFRGFKSGKVRLAPIWVAAQKFASSSSNYFGFRVTSNQVKSKAPGVYDKTFGTACFARHLSGL